MVTHTQTLALSDALSPTPGVTEEFNDFPLSPSQERLWLFEQLTPGTSAYNVPECWLLSGQLNTTVLGQAFQDLLDRHETLRTRIELENGKPVQRVFKYEKFSLSTIDVSSDCDPIATARRLSSEEARKPIPLSRGSLFKACLFVLGTAEHLLFLNLHHAICDEWSLNILRRDLAAFYNARLSFTQAQLPDLPIQFADFAVWQREYIQAEAVRQDVDYWTEQLKGELPASILSPTRTRSNRLRYDGGTFFRTLPAELAASLKEFSRRENVTLFVTLLAAFKGLLHRWSRKEDLVVGVPLAGRDRLETENLIGFFVHTHGLRTRVSQQETFLTLLQKVRAAALGAQLHQNAPLEAVLSSIRADRGQQHHPLFPVFFSLQPKAAEEAQFAALATNRILLENGASKFELSILATECEQGLHLRCEYSTELFDSWLIESFLDSLETFLSAILQSPAQPLAQLPICSADMRRTVVELCNDTLVAARSAPSIHALFESIVPQHTNAPAVHDGERSLTYSELNHRANLWAKAIREQTAGQNCSVGVCLPRTVDLVTGLLAILKAGAAYVPLDPRYPLDRLNYMLQDSGAVLLLTNHATAPIFKTPACPLVHVEALDQTGAVEHVTTFGSPHELAYLIYTSGSTGQPKGVALEHHAAVALIEWARRTYSQAEVSAVLASTSVCFDLSIFELFVPLCVGGTVILADNILSFRNHSASDSVTLINTVPSAIRELLRAGAIPKSTKVINLAGELLPTELVDEIYAQTGVEKVYDLYGPTETTTYSSFTCRRPGAPPTIGRPLDNEQVYVLDEFKKPVPMGMAGELYIGGIGLARGYWNREVLTAEKFVPNPFKPGTRLYRTGDLGRWRGDRSLEYLGRMDHQVKIRGFRIELGEVEAALRSNSAVKDAVVVCSRTPAGDAQLIGYVTPKNGAISTSHLRAALEQKLPTFMVPSVFVVLERLPLTPNGKVDRRALPTPDPACGREREQLAPRNAMECLVADVWKEVLGNQALSITDNFFHIGGHSLLAMQVASRLSVLTDREVPIRSVFEAPTIAQLAQNLAEAQATNRQESKLVRHTSSAERARELLARLDELSDEQVEALLADTEWKKSLQ